MSEWVDFYPQDRIFHAYDLTLRRLGLPGIHIQIVVHLRGAVDVEGLRRSVAGIQRLYPVTDARLVCHPVNGRPRWRLLCPSRVNGRLQAGHGAVHVHSLAPATEAAFHAANERLLMRPIDAGREPPLQFHVFRGLTSGDRVVIRWPHAFMDVRGLVLLAEDLERLYQSGFTPEEVVSAGDECRQDFAALLNGQGWAGQATTLLKSLCNGSKREGRELRLPTPVMALPMGRIRCAVRHLSAEQTAHAQETSLRVCGFARLGDFVRATAVRSMHRVLGVPVRRGDGYSTLNMIDHRRRRQRGPVCHNLFSGLPLRVPAELAEDRRRSADCMRDQTADILASGGVARHLAAVNLISQLPPAVLSHCMYRNMRPGTSACLPVGLGTPPSIQVGFSGDSTTYESTFCGAVKELSYGVGVPPPLSGFAVDLNLTGKRLHLSATWFESRVSSSTMEAMIDDLACSLMRAD